LALEALRWSLENEITSKAKKSRADVELYDAMRDGSILP
jgi:hypothetical protein